MKTLIVVIGLFLPFYAYSATYEGGERTVSSIRFSEDYIKIRFSPAPQGCEGNDDYRMHVHIDQNAENKDELISALLAAYAAKLKVAHIWYEEGGSCGPGSTLKLTAFELKQE
ncbi:hypothetical protein QSV34_07635 [Porticoccus sp. W117]|uniref:hypothetical protein n=1 Tax=Porticoccus sp. W117 TaxID=3054777 RepID=UPI002598DE7F|nr:hypothetical protein [Porticoccus sp. W117]MDM3871225.1 hypothetical protein [Porticoccus sp. W117]